MAGDLTAALLSGNAGVAADPMLAQVAPRMQLAQALAQQGMSGAPASPWQAAGRLGSALAGALIQGDASSELTHLYQGGIDAASKSLPEDHPLQPFLRSSNPLARMLGYKALDKALIQLSETKALKAGETAGYPVPGQPATIANTGAAAAAAEAKKNPPLIARAAGEAAAKSGFEGGGEGVFQTPTGPQVRPISAAMRRQMELEATGGAGQPGAPPVQPPTMQPKAVKTVPAGTYDRETGRVSLGVGGKPLGNAAIEPMVKADTEEVAKDRESAAHGQQDMATVRMIQDFLPKVRTGWSAESRLEGARILHDMGVSDEKLADWMKTDVAAGQILQKKFLELSSAAARTLGAREPGSVISMFAKAYPSLGTDEKAIRLQTNALYMDRLRAQQLAQEKTNYVNESVNGVQQTGQYRGLKGFNEQFNKSHNPEAYLSAAESMSGVPQAWQRIKDPRQQSAVIALIPPGTTYMSPDGKMRIKP